MGVRNIELRLDYFKNHANPSLPKTILNKQQVIEACELALQEFKNGE